MRGVDKVDQKLQSIQSLRKAYKWYKKLTLRLEMQVTLNVYEIFQLYTGDNNKTYQQFSYDTIVLNLSIALDKPPVLDYNGTIKRSSGRHLSSTMQ